MSPLNTILFLASSLSLAASYDLKLKYDASNFFDSSSFDFYSGYDVFTKGLALYTPKDQATSSGLAKITSDRKVYLGVDTTTTLTSSKPGQGNGRKSVRLEGVQTFDNGLIIADFDHLPATACGQWPAFWLLHDQFPQENWYSEIDIIEGISGQTNNEITMYTNPTTCTMNDAGGYGTTRTLDCRLNQDGCGADGPDGTFGKGFNAKNGGFYATQVESDGVKIWYFARGSAPADITSSNPNPSTWGPPMMNFAPKNCDMKTAFRKMKIIINITFCGSYAGDSDAWNGYTQCKQSTSVKTCNDYVAKTPGAFTDVYFLINSVKVFQNPAAATLFSSKTTLTKKTVASSISFARGTSSSTLVTRAMGKSSSTSITRTASSAGSSSRSTSSSTRRRFARYMATQSMPEETGR